MKLYIAEESQKFNVLVYIGLKESDILSYIPERDIKDFLQLRISRKKKITIIPDKTRFRAYILLDKKSGDENEILEEARKLAFEFYSSLRDHDVQSPVIVDAGAGLLSILAFVEGLWLTNYDFSKYITHHETPPFSIAEVGITSKGLTEKEISDLSCVLEGNSFARDLVNEPLSYLTANKLSEEIVAKGAIAGYTTEVFNKKKIESLRMGGLLAVNKGSIDPPTFSILEWKPDNVINKKPYILVGKGVVFDSGGLSLKPTLDSMDYMKSDMAGAAAVAGTIYAIAKAKLPVHVIGLIPATDNRPDGNAYVPGDIVTMHNGKTVEVLNTDAEGRMILADALSYASQFDPELVVELSTLTGSAQVAVGKYAIVGMGNSSTLIFNSLKESGFRTFERIAEFPFWDDYSELLKSDIADLKNIGGKYAGAITAGKFLENFTDYPYIHLDIAGPAYNKLRDNYRGKGGSGIGVRLLFDFFKQLSQ